MINENKSPTACIEAELSLFEKTLREIILSEDNFLMRDLEIFMFSNPKRLRVIFVFLFSKILKLEHDFVLKIALIVELLHSASLIHDDIIDDEKIRRENLTFNAKFSPKLAVLEGDLLLSMALNVLSETNLDILKIFSAKIKATINGEIEQNENINKITDEKKYFKKTLNKTGNLFLAGLSSLFALRDFDSQIKEDLFNFMTNYSIAFQMRNDIDNIKTTKSDIKNGNYTLTMLYFFMENTCDFVNLEHTDFSKYIKKAEQKFNEFKNLTFKSLEKIPDSIYKDSLFCLCNSTLRS